MRSEGKQDEMTNHKVLPFLPNLSIRTLLLTADYRRWRDQITRRDSRYSRLQAGERRVRSKCPTRLRPRPRSSFPKNGFGLGL